MDTLHRFLFDRAPVRGALVRLDASWRDLLARRASVSDGGHAFAPPLRALLGEMAAAGVLMQANLKFNGALVLQLQGDGPVKLAVVETQPDFSYRATAKVVGAVADDAGLAALVNLHGRGRCAITLDPRDRLPGQQPYQGVVPLHGDRREPLQRLSEVLEHYMLQSEQVDTRLVLAANDERAAGLLLQRLPSVGGGHVAGRPDAAFARSADEDQIGRHEDFNRLALLAATLSADELLGLDAEVLLRRLFWQEPLRLLGDANAAPARPRFVCRCTRERVAGMLRSLGQQEIDGLIAERGEAEVGCDFCGAVYRFDRVDAAALFSAGPPPPAEPRQMH